MLQTIGHLSEIKAFGMSSTPLDEIFDALASLQECPNCGCIYDSDVDGDRCACCKKTYDRMLLRETTMDTARIDYDEIEEMFSDLESGEKSRKRKHAPTSITTKAVMAEFEDALIADGYTIGANRDGTALKYSRYARMLFDHAIFSTRADFFLPGARVLAHQFYRSEAEKKAFENGGKTSAKKLYRNFANGFDKFVLLCGP